MGKEKKREMNEIAHRVTSDGLAPKLQPTLELSDAVLSETATSYHPPIPQTSPDIIIQHQLVSHPLSGMVSCHCFLLFSVVLHSIQLSLSRFAVLGNQLSLVCVLALLPSLTLTSCRVLGNRQVFYLSTVSCNLLVEFWAIEHLQLSFGSLDLVRSSYSPGSGSGRPPHLHQVNRCLLPRNRVKLHGE